MVRNQAATASVSRLENAAAQAVILADLDLLRPFVGAGISTTLLLTPMRRYMRFSRHVRDWRPIPDPARDPDRALETLLMTAGTFAEKPVLFYADDAALALLRRHRALIESAYRILTPDDEMMDICADKTRFAEFAHANGITTPRGVCGDHDAIAEFADRVGFPLAIKPASHIDWFASEAVALAGGRTRKIVLARDRGELDRFVAAARRFAPRFLVQEFIPGRESQIFSYHAFLGRDHAPIASFVGRKIRTNPSVGGESSYVELALDGSISRLGEEIARRLKLRGPVKIDVKRDPRSGRDHVLEVNLRYNLWHQLGAANGVNLPLCAYRHLTGAPAAADPAPRTDIRWLDIGADLSGLVRDYRPAGELTVASYLRSLRGPKVHHIFAWDDPVPFAILLVDKIRRKLMGLFSGGRGARQRV